MLTITCIQRFSIASPHPDFDFSASAFLFASIFANSDCGLALVGGSAMTLLLDQVRGNGAYLEKCLLLYSLNFFVQGLMIVSEGDM